MSKIKLSPKERLMIKFWFEEGREVKWITERYNISQTVLLRVVRNILIKV